MKGKHFELIIISVLKILQVDIVDDKIDAWYAKLFPQGVMEVENEGIN